MRKACGICALVAYLALLVHVSLSFLECALGVYWPPSLLLFGVLCCAVILHAILALVLMVKGIKGKGEKANQGNSYNRLNRPVWVRRISGLVILVLVLVHALTSLIAPWNYTLLGATGVWGAVQTILFVLMVLSLLMHLVNSVEALFIGLGVKLAQWLLVLIKVIVALILLLGLIAVLCMKGGLL